MSYKVNFLFCSNTVHTMAGAEILFRVYKSGIWRFLRGGPVSQRVSCMRMWLFSKNFKDIGQYELYTPSKRPAFSQFLFQKFPPISNKFDSTIIGIRTHPIGKVNPVCNFLDEPIKLIFKYQRIPFRASSPFARPFGFLLCLQLFSYIWRAPHSIRLLIGAVSHKLALLFHLVITASE